MAANPPPLILVACNDPSIRSLLIQALALEGYVVRAGGYLDEIERLTRSLRPDLLLFDVTQCGGATGWDAAVTTTCWRICTTPETTHIPMIVLAEDLDASPPVPRLPVRSYLGKPFDLADLFRLVSMWVGARVETGDDAGRHMH